MIEGEVMTQALFACSLVVDQVIFLPEEDPFGSDASGVASILLGPMECLPAFQGQLKIKFGTPQDSTGRRISTSHRAK
jgi:hypothetical protein